MHLQRQTWLLDRCEAVLVGKVSQWQREGRCPREAHLGGLPSFLRTPYFLPLSWHPLWEVPWSLSGDTSEDTGKLPGAEPGRGGGVSLGFGSMDLPSHLRDPQNRENCKCLNRWLSQGHSRAGAAEGTVAEQWRVGHFSPAAGQVSQSPQGTPRVTILKFEEPAYQRRTCLAFGPNL